MENRDRRRWKKEIEGDGKNRKKGMENRDIRGWKIEIEGERKHVG